MTTNNTDTDTDDNKGVYLDLDDINVADTVISRYAAALQTIYDGLGEMKGLTGKNAKLVDGMFRVIRVALGDRLVVSAVDPEIEEIRQLSFFEYNTIAWREK